MKKFILLNILIFCGGVINISFAQTWQTVGSAGFTETGVDYFATSIGHDGTLFVVYSDVANGNKASVMKYNGSSWLNVGLPGFSAGLIEIPAIAINSSGVPYVSYLDETDSNKITVMKYNGTSWVVVGSVGFSIGFAAYINILINASDIPYVAFGDGGIDGKVSVMKFNGSSWVYVGSEGFSPGIATDISLAFDNTGIPYVAYTNFGTDYKSSVMKYNGSGWVYVGTSGFTTSDAFSNSLAIDHDNTPYIAFQDWGHQQKLSVMKYNGSGWVNVGSPGISSDTATTPSLVIDKANQPCVAYENGHWVSGRADVVQYNGSAWIPLGDTGFSAGIAYNTTLLLDSNGIPYVGYDDGSILTDAFYGNATVKKLKMPLINGTSAICAGIPTTFTDSASGGTWLSKNLSVATINTTSGLLTPIAAGVDTITYTVYGIPTNYTISIDTALPHAGTITAGRDSLCRKDTITIHNTLVGGTWATSNTALASISSSGILTGIASGDAMVDYIVTNVCGSDTATFSFVVGNCTEEVENLSTPRVVVFPNPANDEVNVTGVNEATLYRITTITGVTAQKGVFQAGVNILSLNEYASGVYILEMVNSLGVKTIVRLVKQ